MTSEDIKHQLIIIIIASVKDNCTRNATRCQVQLHIHANHKRQSNVTTKISVESHTSLGKTLVIQYSRRSHVCHFTFEADWHTQNHKKRERAE